MIGRIGLALALAAGLSFAADDVVRPKSGAELKGKITRLEIDGVTIEAGGATKTLRAEEVAGFTLGDIPPKQREAETAMNGRNFDEAVKAYTAALGELKPGRGDLHKQFVYQGLVRAQKAKNDPDAAIESVLAFLKACPKAWNYVETAREGIDVAMKKSSDAKAKEIINAMRAAADPMKGFGAIEAARLQVASKDFGGAQAALSAIANNNNQPYATDAKVWLIRAMRGKKDTASLEPLCKGIVGTKGVPASLMQAACSGLGDVHMEKAKGGDKEAVHDAILAYAQAISIGPPPKDSAPDDYASALVKIAWCYTFVGLGAGKETAVAAAKAKAMGYYVEVMRQFPDTDWGVAAKKEYDALSGTVGPTDGEPK